VTYLAVPEMPRRTFWASLRRRNTMAEWHALAEYSPPPMETLCGYVSVLEPHRTWEQTLPDARCPRCERLMEAADRARDVMAAAGAAPPMGPFKAELLRRRVREGA